MDWQTVIVGVAVALAAAFVFRKYFPKTVYTWRQKTAIALLRENRGGLRQWLGNKVAVRGAGQTDAHCDDCNGCD